MSNKNAVLALMKDGENQFVKILAFDETDLPETLNGESGYHIYHVRMLTELILSELKNQGLYSLSDDDIKAISTAASLHDIGKLRIPKSILDFPGRFSPLQYDIVKKHSVFGEKIIQELDFGDIDPKLKKHAAEIARCH
ncbi:MAG: HD domain-containing protein, partial [Clostridia bacterium]|nr:HD domain-containing protein [Clostridia bacterium]